MRLFASIMAGKVDSMENNNPTFRSLDDTQDRITMDTDNRGNRTNQQNINLEFE